MLAELDRLGLLPGTVKYGQSGLFDGQSSWRIPPPGDRQARAANQLPRPNDFWIHPMFIWMPESMYCHSFADTGLPCLSDGCSGRVSRKRLGRPRVVVGSGGGMIVTGQYYIMSSLRTTALWTGAASAYPRSSSPIVSTPNTKINVRIFTL